jgi:DNA-binding NarL/FixJ family response regulator
MAKLSAPFAVTIIIADPSRIACQLMSAAVRRSRYRISVLSTAVDSESTLAQVGEYRPDVVVVSCRLKDGVHAGFQVSRKIRAAHLKTSVIMVLDFCDQESVLQAFRNGAHGVFSRDDSFEVLCRCIHSVYQGNVWASRKQLRSVIEFFAQAVPKTASLTTGVPQLTKRELGVVSLVAEGCSNRDISQQLHLSEHTVRNHLFRIYNKLGTSNRVELAMYATNKKSENDRNIDQSLMKQ